jgi:hypothetical protein
VRALINEGCRATCRPRSSRSSVVVEAGSDAAALDLLRRHPSRRGPTPPQVCAATHVTYLDAPVRRVLSLIPPLYKDIWTAAKGFYKLEPVVADGGEVILYAP